MSLYDKQIQLRDEYRLLTDRSTEQLNKFTHKILDAFEAEYLKDNTNITALYEFMSFFINGRFRKQIKYNIWVYLAFLKSTELTTSLLKILRDKYNKTYLIKE